MPSVISQIAEWGATLPSWEQVALERIITVQSFTDDVYEDLLQILLEEKGMVEQKSERPQSNLDAYVNKADGPVAGKSILRQISNLENINALVPNQKLEFGEKVTVIFGENGSGKSGYARVIASAAFTRGDKEILRNIQKPLNEAEALSADFYLQDGESSSPPIHHIVGQPCPEMRSFYVFDSTSVRAHLTKSNAMSFAPANLDILTKLAEVSDEVRKRLDQRIERIRKPSISPLLFDGETEVSKEISALSSRTDESKVFALGTMTPAELSNITELDRKIAELKSTDFQNLIASINQKIGDIKTLIGTLEDISNSLSDSVIANVQQTVSTWHQQSAIANQFSFDSFKVDGLSFIGSPVWYEFAKAALSLALTESTDEPYPKTDSVCLLCHQPLLADSRDHLNHLWEMLKSDTQKNILELEERLQSSEQYLTSIDFDFFGDQTVSYRILKTENQPAFQVIEIFLDSCKARRNQLLTAITNKTVPDISELPKNGVAELWILVGALEFQQKSLEEKRDGADTEIQQLGSELKLLQHRKILSAILEDVLALINSEKWIQQASTNKIRGTTAHITKKYNALFSELVTDKYLDLFTLTLQNLKCPLGVEIRYKAEKGKTFKQLALKTNEKFPRDQSNPDKVLSEGEQRAVALADFFTEIASDEQSAGFILDDPVTSLDFRWKEVIAENIVREAINKQAIVFTHDLHFLHCLKTKSDEKSIDIRAHWIQKRDEIPGYVFNDNSPMSEKDYKNAKQAKEFCKKSAVLGITAEEQQYCLEAGFAALRTSYEAFIMFELFSGVVLRFEERISGDRLKKIYIDDEIRDDVAESIGRISRYIGAHLHSDTHAAQKPTPQMLTDELNRFDELRNLHKKKKKDHGIMD